MPALAVTAVSIVAGAAFISTANAQIQFSGDEFQINSTLSSERGVTLGALSNGGFIAVWTRGSGGSDDVVARRFDGAGAAVGGEFVVSSYTSGLQELAAVASAPNGELVVSWASRFQQDGVYGRRLDAAGQPIGTEFPVATDISGSRVTWTSNDEFVAAWGAADADERGVFARRFDSSGAPLGAGFQVNSYTTGAQYLSDIATLSDGNVVVVWSGDGQSSFSSDVYARRLDSSGAPLGGEFQVNTTTVGYQYGGDVAALASGEFLVAWSSGDVFAQRFSNSGATVGTEFQVNSEDYGAGAALGELVDGSFVVTWKGLLAGALGPVARHFDADSTAFGPDFRVSTHTATDQAGGSIVATSDGGFVIAWDGRSDLIGRSFCVGGAGPDADFDGVPDKCDRCAAADDADDADGDGTPDQCDLCTNVAGAREITVKPRIVLSTFNLRDDRASLRGGFTVGTSFAALDPITAGARVVVRVDGGSALLDLLATPGAFDGTKGWTVNRAGTRFKYKGKNPAGLRKLRISDRDSSSSPGRIDILAKVVVPELAQAAGGPHTNATIVVGDPTLGECGETGFLANECERKVFSFAHGKTTCRR